MRSSSLEHEVILIIEDSHLDSMLIQRITENNGGVGFVARSFSEAAVIASQLKVTAVTIDVDLGGQETGFDVVMRLREMLGEGFEPRMLVVSGKCPNQVELDLEKSLPVTGILQKPVVAEALVNGLKRSAGQRIQTNSSAVPASAFTASIR